MAWTGQLQAEMGEEEEMGDVVNDVREPPAQPLLRSAHRRSQESFESTETEGPADSPLRIHRSQALRIRSRHASVQSEDRSSLGKVSADQSSIVSEDRSKSDTSSTDNVPAPELTKALVSAC